MCLGTWGQVATQPKRAAGEEVQLEMGFKCRPMHEAPALQKTQVPPLFLERESQLQSEWFHLSPWV